MSYNYCHCEEERRSNLYNIIMLNKQYYIYILANKTNSVLYTGVTDNLIKRVYQHKNKLVESFTKKYNVNKLVYYEIFNDINEAIKREKQIKGGSRKKKIELVQEFNPNWIDLYDEIIK